jgi:hypothetical protein
LNGRIDAGLRCVVQRYHHPCRIMVNSIFL